MGWVVIDKQLIYVVDDDEAVANLVFQNLKFPGFGEIQLHYRHDYSSGRRLGPVGNLEGSYRRRRQK